MKDLTAKQRVHWDSSTFCLSDPHCKGSRVSAVVLLERELRAHTELSDLKNSFRSHWAQKPRQKVKNPPMPDLDMGPPKFLQSQKLGDIETPQPLTSQEGLRKIHQCQNT